MDTFPVITAVALIIISNVTGRSVPIRIALAANALLIIMNVAQEVRTWEKRQQK